MWFHHVTALDNSVSVNAWTGCDDEFVVEKIYRQINSFHNNKKEKPLKELRAFIRNTTNLTTSGSQDLYSDLGRDNVRLLLRLSTLLASLRTTPVKQLETNLRK